MSVSTFQPKNNGFQALFDLIYEVKFSRHVPLTVVLLSAIYAVFRSQHYLSVAFKLPIYVSIPTAFFLEALVLGASAVVFIAAREDYITELKGEDRKLSQIGLYLSLTALSVAFVALLGIAWADAYLITNESLPAFLMTLVQFTQALFIVSFIINALLEERQKLRDEYHNQKVADALACPHCKKILTANNRKRHIATCAANPKNAT